MAVTFVLGRSGSGKSSFCFEQIEQRIKQQEQVLYLVPEQMSFQTEYELIRRTNGVLFDTQVLGFKRLAIRILQETGGLSKELIDKQGLRLLVRKFLYEYQSELRVFTKERVSLGLIDEIIAFIQESSNAVIDLHTIAELPLNNQLLADKLFDLAFLADKVREFLGDQYILDADYYSLLASHIEQSEWVRQTHIYIDGFHSLNEQEHIIVDQLMRCAATVTLVLTVSEEAATPTGLFAMTDKTYARFLRGIQEYKIESSVIRMGEPGLARFKAAPDLAALEQYLSLGLRQDLIGDAVKITPFVDRRDELQGVAQQIRTLVQSGVRYGQIAVYVPQKGLYADLLRSTFTEYGIPYFLDVKESMLYHPFLEFIHAAIALVKSKWSTVELLRILKTGFLDVSDDDVARLEVYCQLYGKTGKRDWQSEQPWLWHETRNGFIGEVDEEKSLWVENLRGQIVQPLIAFEAVFAEAKTIRQALQELFIWLKGCGVAERLEAMAASSQDLVLARRHQAVWQQFVQLLDDYVQVAGNDELAMDAFLAMFETGIESLQFAIIPPSFDQVLVGDFERSRFQMASSAGSGAYSFGIQYAFVLGVNEGDVPQIQTDSGIIHNKERLQLQEFAVDLPTLDSGLRAQQFALYTVLCSASKGLSISYLLADGVNGETEKQPSYIIQSLKYLGVAEQPVSGNIRFGKTVVAAIPEFVRSLKLYQQTGTMSLINQTIYNYLLKQNPALLEKMQDSVFFANQTVALNNELLEARFGTTLNGSVSSIESFYNCPFQYYSRQVLQLAEPITAQVQANIYGLLFHQCIEYVSGILLANNRRFAELGDAEIMDYVQTYLEKHAPLAQYGIFMQSARAQYFIKKVRETLNQTIQMLAFQDEHSKFKQQFSEVRFGGTYGKLPAQVYPIDDRHLMQINGVIDRVDQLVEDGQQYWRIIDYKSSGHTFSFADMYYGLNLQMPTYMDVLLQNYPDSKNAGMLYFGIDQSIKSIDGAPPMDLIKSSYTMNGFIVDNPELAMAMDDQLTASAKSLIVPAKLKSDGHFDQNGSRIMNEDDFTTLIDFTRMKYKESGRAIWDGVTTIEPVQEVSKDVPKACTYCKFRSVCQYDRYLNQPKVVHNKSKQEALSQMEMEVQANDGKTSE
ncbi:PD-(D/E)XK nuclease family protein [Culicoidibacter larvae]|uniref:UvrD-like helicase C-terminal domain-containing protein n=1 Tax=Culicoidibacter larvae TaxID=2579976 RepID=A0A5R8QGH8_9FIRM|nr:PD-(D/E)XK nuclease family protein [Culicoidibacter larvae]TLG77082.1 hypothetical protein FEZ08_00255 [Culicoidibacter larvae]